jgi:hypothetical protein
MTATRKTSILGAALATVVLTATALVGLGCEDDGGAPGWNTGLTDGGAVSQPADAGARDGSGADLAGADSRDATVF